MFSPPPPNKIFSSSLAQLNKWHHCPVTQGKKKLFHSAHPIYQEELSTFPSKHILNPMLSSSPLLISWSKPPSSFTEPLQLYLLCSFPFYFWPLKPVFHTQSNLQYSKQMISLSLCLPLSTYTHIPIPTLRHWWLCITLRIASRLLILPPLQPHPVLLP